MIAGITVVAAPIFSTCEIAGTLALVCQQDSEVVDPDSHAMQAGYSKTGYVSRSGSQFNVYEGYKRVGYVRRTGS